MKRLSLVLILIFAFISTVLSQTTGRLSGTVSGPDGLIPNATVTAKDNKTGKELTATSKDDGSFLFPQLEFGTYNVTITATGFKTFVANEVKIDVGREYNLTPTLEIGSVQESVTITAGADVVTSTTAQVTNTVSPQQIGSLPLLTRNPLNLVTLQAGTAPSAFLATTSINGMRTTLTNITRDGINIQDNFIRTNATDFAPGRPSVDDTGEFTISTSNQESDTGYGGAQIRLVTPRGTKDFHGALFAYNRNSHFAANDFFNNRAGLVRPFRNRNQYGGKVGGPFLTPHFGEGGPMFDKNKGFFFFAYEGVKDPVSARANRVILTPSARTGAFSFNRSTAGAPTAICPNGAVGSVCTIPNLLTFAQGQGLAVPSTIDSFIQNQVINQLPTTSNFNGGDGLNTAGFTLNRANNTSSNTFTGRIDLDATDKDNISGVYSYAKQSTLRPDADTNGFSTIPGVSQDSINKTLALAYRRIISANFINEVRGGVFMSEVPFNRTDPLPNFFLASTGTGLIANLLQSGVFTGGSVSYPVNTFLNQGRKTRTFNFQDNADLSIGKHALKFGGQYQFFKIDSYNFGGIVPTAIISAGNGTPAFAQSSFAGAGGISNAQLTTANNLLALFGGLYNSATQNFNVVDQTSGYQPGPQLQPFRYSNDSLYVLDRWNVATGLTLSLGIRYEIYPALKLANGIALEPVISDPNNPVPSLLSRSGTYNFIGGDSGVKNTYYKTDYNNFAPSIGVAYTPNFESGIGKLLFGNNKTVLRGGYSQTYGNDSIVTSINNAAVGNAGLAATTNTLGNINGSLASGTPAIPIPGFITPPRTYLQNNMLANNFGTVFAINPNISVPKIEQYSFGIQREFAKDFALEIRYVGSRSKNLLRGVDLNQIDIFNNGFLADFNRAAANFKLTGDPFCATAGCQSLSIFQQSAGTAGHLGVAPTTAATPAGTLNRTTFINNIINGTPADLALNYLNSAGNLNNEANSNTPSATPFVSFVANPATGAIDYMINDASYNYNSLQIELRRRFSNGLYLQANYTFSKNLTNAVGTSQQLFEPYLDNNNKALDNQRADFDLTHVFNFNGIYQLPFGKGKMFLNQGGFMDKIFGGWELSGIAQWTSGPPITFVDTRGTLNRTGRSARQTPQTNLTNDQIRDLGGIYEANGNIYFINPAVINPATGRAAEGYGSTPFSGQAFFNVNPGQTGNMARNVIDGPKFFNVNAALLKNIKFSETMRVQLRMEAFNVINNVNFSFLTAGEQRQSITSSTFGQITGTAITGSRQVQFAARFEF